MSSINGTPRAATPKSIQRAHRAAFRADIKRPGSPGRFGFAGFVATDGRRWRFRAKACPALDPGWPPVRVKTTHQKNRLYPAAAACRRREDSLAVSIARTRSFGRNGFCRQTTSASSGDSVTKSSVVIPEIATTGRFGMRSRIIPMRSRPLVPCRKISTIARSKLDSSIAFNAAVALAASTISKRCTRSTMEIIARTSAWSSITMIRGIGSRGSASDQPTSEHPISVKLSGPLSRL